LLPEAFVLWERMALLVQKQLFSIGVDMRIETISDQEFNSRIQKSDFEAVFGEVNGGPPLARPFIFWHSSGQFNFFGYRSRAVDEAFDTIRASADDTSYRDGVRQLQQGMTADPPGVFLAWGQTARAVSRSFEIPTGPEERDIWAFLNGWRRISPGNEAEH
jgi:ABC-type transport system substrate-binding protein